MYDGTNTASCNVTNVDIISRLFVRAVSMPWVYSAHFCFTKDSSIIDALQQLHSFYACSGES